MTCTRILLVLAVIASVLPLATAQTAAVCGDCDLDGITPNVLDALGGAKIDVGLTSASPQQLQVCDVDSDLDIDMIDTLLMAQDAVGLVVSLACPNGRPTAGGCSVAVFGRFGEEINYTLADAESDPINILVEFSLDMGATWAPATESMFGSDGTMGLTSSPTGVAHLFIWQQFTDIIGAMAPCFGDYLIRITPSDATGPGSPCTTPLTSYSQC